MKIKPPEKAPQKKAPLTKGRSEVRIGGIKPPRKSPPEVLGRIKRPKEKSPPY